MNDTHVYLGLINLALTTTQRDQLIAALAALGPNTDPQPCHLNHRRVRIDGEAVIYEALFDAGTISITNIKTYLGAVFGVDPALISHSVAYQTFSALPTGVVTFTYNASARIRMAFFGKGNGDWPTWEQSRLETAAYIKANQGAWETMA